MKRTFDNVLGDLAEVWDADEAQHLAFAYEIETARGGREAVGDTSAARNAWRTLRDQVDETLRLAESAKRVENIASRMLEAALRSPVTNYASVRAKHLAHEEARVHVAGLNEVSKVQKEAMDAAFAAWMQCAP